MKIKFIYLLLTVGLFSLMESCSNEEMPACPNLDVTGNSTHPELDRALQIVDEMMKELDGGATRSSRRIATIEQVNQPTRSDAQAPNWFLVNYDNEAGFALVNDAKIACPVYSISDTGHLAMSDTIENKGLAMVLSNIFVMGYVDALNEEANSGNMNTGDQPNDWGGGYFPGDIVLPYHPVDSLGRYPVEDILPFNRTVKPLLTEYVHKWAQGEPFNILCPMVYNEKTGEERRGSVGCGPLAVAMIMSHYQWPLSYYSASPDETYEFHWDEIRNYPYRYATSRLTREISRAYNMDAQWTYKGTSVSDTRLPVTFENFGYRKPTIESFEDIALNTILNLAPVFVFSRGINKDGVPVGHMWVVDGLCSYTSTSTEEQESETSFFFHNVWGWSGMSNGYFKMAYKTNTDDPYQYDDPWFPNKSGYTFFNFSAIGRLFRNK